MEVRVEQSMRIASSWMHQRFEQIRRVWSSARVPTQLYVAGFGIVFLGGTLVPKSLLAPVAMGGAVLLAAGFAIEAYERITAWLETHLGKLIGALIAAAVVPMALGLAGNVVNEATGQNPADLPYAVGTLAPLTAGYFLFLAAMLLVMLTFSVGLVIALASLVGIRRDDADPHRIDREGLKLCLRAVAALCLTIVVQSAWNSGRVPYEQSLRWVAQIAAFTLDTYPRDGCRQSQAERVKRINDTVVIVARQQGKSVTFSRRSCPLGAMIAPP